MRGPGGATLAAVRGVTTVAVLDGDWSVESDRTEPFRPSFMGLDGLQGGAA